MTAACEIARYRPTHKAQVAALQTLLWSPDPNLNQRYLEWRLEENPYGTEPVIYLAFQGGELVGMRGFYHFRWELGSPPEEYSVLVADDAVIVPQHRNRGLATMIMRAAFEDLARSGHQYVFNLSGGIVTVVGSLAMGWKSAGAMEPISLEGLNPARWARHWLRRTPFLRRYAASPFLRSPRERAPFSRLDRMSRLQPGGSILVEREPRLDAMSELVTRLGHDGRIRQVRDREFFAWRFRNPLRDYRFLYCGNTRLEGYLVLMSQHPTTPGPTRVKIVDLEATSASVRSELLDAAIDLGRFPELFAWAATLPGEARTYLVSRGFKPADLELRARVVLVCWCGRSLLNPPPAPGCSAHAGLQTWRTGTCGCSTPWPVKIMAG
jgi:GNAT superfamily N-acetyltransferase